MFEPYDHYAVCCASVFIILMTSPNQSNPILFTFYSVQVAEAFDDITEEQINEIIQKDLLPDNEFDRLRDQISALLQPIASQ